MDIARPSRSREKRIRRLVIGGAGLLALLLVTLGLSRLKPAAPSVDRATVWMDTVKRGPMIREVRGLGTLVPEEIRWIAAVSEGRVERIVVHPGSLVKPDTVILELVDPELELRALNAESELRAAEAQLAELKVRLESQRLDQEAALARIQSESHQARLQADADEQLAQSGLVADISRRKSKAAAEELEHRERIERQRLEIGATSIEAQLAVQRAQMEERRAQARLRRSQFQALHVRAGIDGVLQQVPVEVGQHVTPGTNLARVAQPSRLKAVVKVAETQARDVQAGQPATVDTRNGAVPAHVARVDPAVQNGTVTVDLVLDGPLPKGARPDLSVDGTIELERLDDVLFVGRPAQAQSDGAFSLFRLDATGREASRVKIRLGRSSASTVEVVEGLAVGDRVILSDTSAWDAYDRIRLN